MRYFLHDATEPMSEFITNHASEVWSAIAGFLTGGTVASLVTVKVVRSQQSGGNGTNVDQSRSRAGGDIVGGSKTTPLRKK